MRLKGFGVSIAIRFRWPFDKTTLSTIYPHFDNRAVFFLFRLQIVHSNLFLKKKCIVLYFYFRYNKITARWCNVSLPTSGVLFVGRDVSEFSVCCTAGGTFLMFIGTDGVLLMVLCASVCTSVFLVVLVANQFKWLHVSKKDSIE